MKRSTVFITMAVVASFLLSTSLVSASTKTTISQSEKTSSTIEEKTYLDDSRSEEGLKIIKTRSIGNIVRGASKKTASKTINVNGKKYTFSVTNSFPTYRLQKNKYGGKGCDTCIYERNDIFTEPEYVKHAMTLAHPNIKGYKQTVRKETISHTTKTLTGKTVNDDGTVLYRAIKKCAIGKPTIAVTKNTKKRIVVTYTLPVSGYTELMTQSANGVCEYSYDDNPAGYHNYFGDKVTVIYTKK